MLAHDTLYEEIKSVIQNKLAIIIGDFNCPNVDWATVNVDQEDNRLIDVVGDSFITQTVTQPLHGDDILNLVLASDPDLTDDCKVGEKLDDCYHHFIHFNIKINFALIDNNAKIPD